MALVHMQDMLRHAYENKYAIGAFDVVNLHMLRGVINAAEKCRAPVILGIAEPHMDHFDLELLAPAVEAAAKRSSVPVAIHFDHGSSLDSVIKGIQQGCNSLMIDASDHDLKTNIETTKSVVKMARMCGIPVEAELGYVPENGGDLVHTTVSEAVGFVRHTEVDSLAVSIGTIHGRLKGKARLDFARLRQINESLGIPLVLHGSSGLTDEQFHKLISNGIAKINYFTALTDLAAVHLRKNVKKGDDDYLQLFAGSHQVVEEETDRLMRVWGSAGRAAEILAQCSPWKMAEHIIKFNLPGCDDAESTMIVERGRKILSAIPGVRDVITSEALDGDIQYQFRWHLRITNASVVEQVKNNTDFKAFSNRYLRDQNTNLKTMTYQEHMA